MSWIFYDLLMFSTSVVLYLMVRWASIYKLPTQVNNLAFFFIPVFVYNITVLFFSHAYHLSLKELCIIIFAGILFSYCSSIFSLRSIEIAPNPGYSLIISKSYVLMTTLLAVLFLHQSISPLGILAVLMIVGFSSLVIVEKKTSKQQARRAWVLLAFGAFLGWGFLSLTAKYLFNQGMPPVVFLASLGLVGLICIVIEVLVKKVSLQPIKQHPWMFIAIGLVSTAFNFFNFYTISVAPNVGYVNATNVASIGAVTVFAIILFKDEFSPRKLVGVIGSILSLTLLFLS